MPKTNFKKICVITLCDAKGTIFGQKIKNFK